jgi:hypothetical protein
VERYHFSFIRSTLRLVEQAAKENFEIELLEIDVQSLLPFDINEDIVKASQN